MSKALLYTFLLVALGGALAVRARWEQAQRVREQDRLAMMYFNQGRLEDAVQALGREIALSPRLAMPYYRLGVIEFQRGRYQQAREALRRALALGIDQPEAPCALGSAAYRMADYGAAIGPLQQCLARNPADDHARYLLAQSYLGMAELDAAETSFKQLLARQPENGQFLYALGTIFLFRPVTPGNNKAALALLSRAVARDPALPGAYYTLGVVYRRAGRWRDAAEALETALRRDAKMQEAHYLLGLVYRHLGREREAAVQFQQARAAGAANQRDRRLSYLRGEVQRNPINPVAHYQLGSLLAELGDRSGAVTELEAALRLNPQLFEARERLDQLRAKPDGKHRE